MKKLDYMREWIVTDPDCNQRYMELNPGVYLFQEDRVINPDTFETEIYESEIYLSEYTENQKKEAMETFGYQLVGDVIIDCGGNTFKDRSLIAECLFELET